MAHPNELVGVAIISTVALISLALTLLAGLAWRRSNNAKLGFVTAAFGVMFLKSSMTAYSIETGFLGHEDLELAGSLGDLVVVMLLLSPFAAALLRRSP